MDVLTDKLFTNGCWTDSHCARHVDVVNPATGQLVAPVPDADASDVDRAVAAARATFEKKSWRGMDPSRRERILWNIAGLLANASRIRGRGRGPRGPWRQNEMPCHHNLDVWRLGATGITDT